jgi:hypothetical protein
MTTKSGRVHLKDIKQGMWYWSVASFRNNDIIRRVKVKEVSAHKTWISQFKKIMVMCHDYNMVNGTLVASFAAPYDFVLYGSVELGMKENGHYSPLRVGTPGVVEALFKSQRKMLSFLKLRSTLMLRPSGMRKTIFGGQDVHPLPLFDREQKYPTGDWLAERIRSLNDGVDAERDYFNVWTEASSEKPFIDLSKVMPLSDAGEMPDWLKDYEDLGLSPDKRMAFVKAMAYMNERDMVVSMPRNMGRTASNKLLDKMRQMGVMNNKLVLGPGRSTTPGTLHPTDIADILFQIEPTPNVDQKHLTEHPLSERNKDTLLADTTVPLSMELHRSLSGLSWNNAPDNELSKEDFEKLDPSVQEKFLLMFAASWEMTVPTNTSLEDLKKMVFEHENAKSLK